MLVPFAFSDLSRTKLRPAVVRADVERGDRILCQVTSKPYGDPSAVVPEEHAFAAGSLRVSSYARPGKLSTASRDLVKAEVGALTPTGTAQIVDDVVALLQSGTAAGSEM